MYDLESMDRRLLVFGYLFRVANRLQSRMDGELSDLTAKQWFAILALGLFDGPPTLKQLAAACDTSHQNAKQLVGKLAQKGFVAIEADRRDGRAMRIRATAKCEAWDRDNEAMARQFVDRMFDGLDPDHIQALWAGLSRIFDNLGGEADGQSGGGGL